MREVCFIAIIAILLIIISCSSKSEKYNYYDHGGWIDHPPQYNPSPVEPSDDTGNLCAECMKLCNLRVKLGYVHLKDGETCSSRCSLECNGPL